MSFAEVGELNATVGQVFFYIGFVCLMIATALTLISALNYIIRNRAVLKEDSEQ